MKVTFLKRSAGFSLLEVIIAMALFMIIAVAGAGGVIQTYSINTLSGSETQAKLYAQEAIEATHSIAKQNWAAISPGVYGLDISTGSWSFLGNSESLGIYTRTVEIQAVQRDPSGQIVATGGTVDPDTFRVVVNVTWNSSPTQTNNVDLVTYLTNYRQTVPAVGCSPRQADNLQVDVAGANINKKDLRGITLENIATSPGCDLEIDTVTVSWETNTNRKIEEVKIDGTTYWKRNGVGTPTGRQVSGTELDMNNYILTSAMGIVNVDKFKFDGNMTGETKFTIVFKMIDGTTKTVIVDFTGANCSPTQASDLKIDVTGANINKKDLRGITLENIATSPGCDLEIDTVTVSWETNTNRKIEEVKIDGTTYWKRNGVGTPTGRQVSGTELDMNNYILTSAMGIVNVDKFKFDGNMTGETKFTIVFKMIDGSTQTAIVDFTPPPPSPLCSATQAADVVINAAGAKIKKKDLKGITLQNVGADVSCVVTMTHVKLEWSKNSKIKEVKFNGTKIWNDKGIGLPTGKQLSGTVLDVVDTTILTTDGVLSFDKFKFDKNMAGSTFNLTLTFADGSTKSYFGIAP